MAGTLPAVVTCGEQRNSHDIVTMLTQNFLINTEQDWMSAASAQAISSVIGPVTSGEVGPETTDPSSVVRWSGEGGTIAPSSSDQYSSSGMFEDVVNSHTNTRMGDSGDNNVSSASYSKCWEDTSDAWPCLEGSDLMTSVNSEEVFLMGLTSEIKECEKNLSGSQSRVNRDKESSSLSTPSDTNFLTWEI